MRAPLASEPGKAHTGRVKPSDFAGTFTALVTPFAVDDSRALDAAAFDRLLEAQLEGGITGVVPCGTTGESPALTEAEQRTVIEASVRAAKGKAKVIAGTGSNATAKTIQLSQAAEKLGVDAVMVVVPYYNKPTQEGLAKHYIAVAQSVSVPVIVYNIPGRSGVDMLPDAMARVLDAAPNVVAVKEATGNVVRAQELVRRFGDRLCVLSGDDGLTVPMMSVGARGVISVTSNAYPRETGDVVRLMAQGKLGEALARHQALLPVHEAMFLEANPGPVKALLHAKGMMSDAVRGPLVEVQGATREKLLAVVKAYEATR